MVSTTEKEGWGDQVKATPSAGVARLKDGYIGSIYSKESLMLRNNEPKVGIYLCYPVLPWSLPSVGQNKKQTVTGSPMKSHRQQCRCGGTLYIHLLEDPGKQ